MLPRPRPFFPLVACRLKKLLGCLVWISGCWVLSSQVFAQAGAASPSPSFVAPSFTDNPAGNPLQNRAEKIEYDASAGVIRYLNPSFSMPSGEIRADQALFSIQENSLTLKGQIIFRSASLLINAQLAKINLADQTLIFEQATFYDEQNMIFAKMKKVTRRDDNNFYAEDIFISQCLPGDRAIEFSVSSLQLEIENIALAKGITFRVYRLPLVYLPFMAFPTTSQRKTGFLFPNFQLSSFAKDKRSGFLISAPYFWAFSPEHDLTLNTSFRVNGGLSLENEYNYAFLKNQSGQLRLNFYELLRNNIYAKSSLDDTRYDYRSSYEFVHRQWDATMSYYIKGAYNSDPYIYSDYQKSSPSYIYDYQAFLAVEFALTQASYLHFSSENAQKYVYSDRYNRMTDPGFFYTAPRVAYKLENSLAPSLPVNLGLLLEVDRFQRPKVLRPDAGWVPFAISYNNFPSPAWDTTSDAYINRLNGERSQAVVSASYSLDFSYALLKLTALGHHQAYRDGDKALQTTQKRLTDYNYAQGEARLETDLVRTDELSMTQKRRLTLRPFLHYVERSDADQRAGLYVPAGQTLSQTSLDCLKYRNKYDLQDVIPLRKSLQGGIFFFSDSLVKDGEKSRNVELSWTSGFDFLQAERKKQTFKSPLLENSLHPTLWKSPWLPWEWQAKITLLSGLKFTNLLRFDSFANTFVEKRFGVAYSQNLRDSINLQYTNIDRSYKNLDGWLFPESDSVSVTKEQPLSPYWQANITMEWNLLRKKGGLQVNEEPRRDFLTNFSTSLTYLNCCYSIGLVYRDKINTVTIPYGYREVRDKLVSLDISFFSFKSRQNLFRP